MVEVGLLTYTTQYKMTEYFIIHNIEVTN